VQILSYQEEVCSKDNKKIDEGRCISPTLKSYGMLNAYKGCYLSIWQVHSVVPCICTTPDKLCS